MEARAAANSNTLNILRSKKDLSTWILAYTTSVALVGAALVALALQRLPEDIFGLLLFAGLAALAELFSVELFVTSRNSRVSVSSIIAIASILLFGPMAGVLTHMASGIVTGVTNLKSQLSDGDVVSSLRRSSFNAGMLVIAAALAGWTYVVAGGTPGEVNRLHNVVPLIAASTIDTAVNLSILIGVLTLQTRHHPYSIWKQDFRWATPIAIAGGIVGGGVLALAYEMFSMLGLVVFLFPVLATSYSFRVYKANMQVYIDKLEQANLDLEEANLGLLETLGAVIDAYDVFTYGHSTQVATYAGAIAEKMGLPDEEQAKIVRGALVHDVGKIGIGDTVIGKPGRLTDEEYNVLKRHTLLGAEIVGQMEGLRELVPLVRHHHERWDGKGYPDGLAGDEIPLGARILTLADSLDAMLSDRPYRPTANFSDILQEVARCTGSQFDPDVVDAFFEVVEEKDRDFFKNSAATVDRTMRCNGLADETKHVSYFLKKSMVLDDTE